MIARIENGRLGLAFRVLRRALVAFRRLVIALAPIFFLVLWAEQSSAAGVWEPFFRKLIKSDAEAQAVPGNPPGSQNGTCTFTFTCDIATNAVPPYQDGDIQEGLFVALRYPYGRSTPEPVNVIADFGTFSAAQCVNAYYVIKDLTGISGVYMMGLPSNEQVDYICGGQDDWGMPSGKQVPYGQIYRQPEEPTLCKIVRDPTQTPIYQEIECEDGNRYPNPWENGDGPGSEEGCTASRGPTGVMITCGTSMAWVYDGEQGPQGEKGDQGDHGEQGEQGIQGEQGEQGPQGEKGDKGDTGATGAAGAQGAQGPQGEKGDTGDTGATGAAGAQGAQGPQGEKGDKGDTGSTGAAGAQGAQGPQGDKGDKGDKGEKGDQGDQGLQGEKGDRGDDGGSCTVTEGPGALTVTCDDGRTGTIPHPAGCDVTTETDPLGGGGLRVTCGDESGFVPFPEPCIVSSTADGFAMTCPDSELSVSWDDVLPDGGGCTVERMLGGAHITCGDETVSIWDGEQGEPGTPGADGRDGRDGRDGQDGATGATGAAGADGRDGQDGEGCTARLHSRGVEIICGDTSEVLEGEASIAASEFGCAAPPTCDEPGDVRCAALMLQWRGVCRPDDDADGLAACDASPTCTGTPVECAKLDALWAIRCRIDEVVTGAEDCSAAPTCEGPALECSQVVDYWRVRCALTSSVMPASGCDVPPDCSGSSAILCAIHEEQWRARCSLVESEVGAIGTCDGPPPTCSGDPIACAHLQLSWSQRCSVRVSQGTDVLSCDVRPACESISLDGSISSECALVVEAWESRCGAAEKSTLEVAALDALYSDAPAMPDDYSLGPPITSPDVLGQLDSSGWIGGGACPVFDVIDVMGTSIDFNLPAWCDVLSLLRVMVQLAAGFIAFRVIMGG